MTHTLRRAALAIVAVLACLIASIGGQVTQAHASPASPWPANADWQQYDQAPSTPLIYPHSGTDVTGNVTNPQTLTHPDSGQTITLTRAIVAGLQDNGPDSWPSGTTATASSTHAGSSTVNFYPSNALDGNPSTYWNSTTPGRTDWLEITTPSPVTLPGLTFLSNANGIPVNFQIQTWDAATSTWVTQVAVTNNKAGEVSQLFPAPVTTQHVRIYITLNQAASDGQYSRIAEVYPYYAPETSVVLDYGKEVGGWPEFKVTGVTGSPTLLAGYSETLNYLTSFGDTTVSEALLAC